MCCANTLFGKKGQRGKQKQSVLLTFCFSLLFLRKRKAQRSGVDEDRIVDQLNLKKSLKHSAMITTAQQLSKSKFIALFRCLSCIYSFLRLSYGYGGEVVQYSNIKTQISKVLAKRYSYKRAVMLLKHIRVLQVVRKSSG